ncbi:FixH family protein [Paenibacillus sp. NPDC056933]|uniref:FixH family protein n=1 Tax=Paenibacillus sp. NPDC056933 TaxID=3345968 RepID=UPI00363DA76E
MSGQVRWFMSLIILVLLTVGCSNQEQSQTGEMPEMIKVELMVPEKVSLHKPVSLEVKLMQGGKPLIHADQVQFQIWNKLDEPQAVSPELGMMTAEKLEEQGALKASEAGEGIYEVKYTFEEPGTYVVQAHVTHGAMHSMPRATVVAK